MAGEGVGQEQRFAMAGGDEEVSDDCFRAFIDEEGIAADAAAVERDEAGEDAGVKVLKQQIGRAAIVPAEALEPDVSLFIEQRPELARGEVAEIQNFDLLRARHRGWDKSSRDERGMAGSGA